MPVDEKEDMKDKKAGKGKVAKGKSAPPEPEEQEVGEKDRTMDALEDKSLEDDSVISITDMDNLDEKFRRRTFALMDKKLKQYERDEDIFNRPKVVKQKRSTKPKQIFKNLNVIGPNGKPKGSILDTDRLVKNDMHLMKTSNPNYFKALKKHTERDKQMLLKRREGTIMKNMAMQQDLEHQNKKVDKELRKLIF